MSASKAKALEKQREDVPEDWMAAKAELFGIDPPTQSLWVCGLRPALKRLKDQRWLVVGPRVPVPKPLAERLPVLERPDRVVHNTKPASLDHLKELVGIPNRALETAERIAPLAQSPRSGGGGDPAGASGDTAGPAGRRGESGEPGTNGAVTIVDVIPIS